MNKDALKLNIEQESTIMQIPSLFSKQQPSTMIRGSKVQKKVSNHFNPMASQLPLTTKHQDSLQWFHDVSNNDEVVYNADNFYPNEKESDAATTLKNIFKKRNQMNQSQITKKHTNGENSQVDVFVNTERVMESFRKTQTNFTHRERNKIEIAQLKLEDLNQRIKEKNANTNDRSSQRGITPNSTLFEQSSQMRVQYPQIAKSQIQARKPPRGRQNNKSVDLGRHKFRPNPLQLDTAHARSFLSPDNEINTPSQLMGDGKIIAFSTSKDGVSSDHDNQGMFFSKRRLSQNQRRSHQSQSQPRETKDMGTSLLVKNLKKSLAELKKASQKMNLSPSGRYFGPNQQNMEVRNQSQGPIFDEINRDIDTANFESRTNSQIQYDLNGRKNIKKTSAEELEEFKHSSNQQQLIEQKYRDLNQNYANLFKRPLANKSPRHLIDSVLSQGLAQGPLSKPGGQFQNNINNSIISIIMPQNNIDRLQDEMAYPLPGRFTRSNMKSPSSNWDAEIESQSNLQNSGFTSENDPKSKTGFTQNNLQISPQQDKEATQRSRKQKTHAASFRRQESASYSSLDNSLERLNNRMLMKVLLNNLKMRQTRRVKKVVTSNHSRLSFSQGGTSNSQERKFAIRNPRNTRMKHSSEDSNITDPKANQQRTTSKVNQVKNPALNQRQPQIVNARNQKGTSVTPQKRTAVKKNEKLSKTQEKSIVKETSNLIKGLLKQNQLFKDIDEEKINAAMEQLLQQKERMTNQASLPQGIKAQKKNLGDYQTEPILKAKQNMATRNHLKTSENLHLQTSKKNGSETGSRGNRTNSTANFAQDSQTLTLARDASKMNKYVAKDSINSKIASSNETSDVRRTKTMVIKNNSEDPTLVHQIISQTPQTILTKNDETSRHHQGSINSDQIPDFNRLLERKSSIPEVPPNDQSTHICESDNLNKGIQDRHKEIEDQLEEEKYVEKTITSNPSQVFTDRDGGLGKETEGLPPTSQAQISLDDIIAEFAGQPQTGFSKPQKPSFEEEFEKAPMEERLSLSKIHQDETSLHSHHHECYDAILNQKFNKRNQEAILSLDLNPKESNSMAVLKAEPLNVSTGNPLKFKHKESSSKPKSRVKSREKMAASNRSKTMQLAVVKKQPSTQSKQHNSSELGEHECQRHKAKNHEHLEKIPLIKQCKKDQTIVNNLSQMIKSDISVLQDQLLTFENSKKFQANNYSYEKLTLLLQQKNLYEHDSDQFMEDEAASSKCQEDHAIKQFSCRVNQKMSVLETSEKSIIREMVLHHIFGKKGLPKMVRSQINVMEMLTNGEDGQAPMSTFSPSNAVETFNENTSYCYSHIHLCIVGIQEVKRLEKEYLTLHRVEELFKDPHSTKKQDLKNNIMTLIGNSLIEKQNLTRFDEYSVEKQRRNNQKYPLLKEMQANLMQELQRKTKDIENQQMRSDPSLQNEQKSSWSSESDKDLESTLSIGSKFEFAAEEMDHDHSFENLSEESDCDQGSQCKQKSIKILMKLQNAKGTYFNSHSTRIKPNDQDYPLKFYKDQTNESSQHIITFFTTDVINEIVISRNKSKNENQIMNYQMKSYLKQMVQIRQTHQVWQFTQDNIHETEVRLNNSIMTKLPPKLPVSIVQNSTQSGDQLKENSNGRWLLNDKIKALIKSNIETPEDVEDLITQKKKPSNAGIPSLLQELEVQPTKPEVDPKYIRRSLMRKMSNHKIIKNCKYQKFNVLQYFIVEIANLLEQHETIFWNKKRQISQWMLKPVNQAQASGAYDSMSSDDDLTYNQQQYLQSMHCMAYHFLPIKRIMMHKNSQYEIFKILSQTKMDKIRNKITFKESTEFTRDRLKMINSRYNQILRNVMSEKTQVFESDLSSELNYSDSLDQKAVFIYVEELEYQKNIRMKKQMKSKKRQTLSIKNQRAKAQVNEAQPVYGFRYGDKSDKTSVSRQKSGKQNIQNLLRLNNDLYIDMDNEDDVDVKFNHITNLVLKNKKREDAKKVQKLYNQVKEQARKTSRGKSVHLFVKKRCLNEEQIDNILMLDAENYDIHKLENTVITSRIHQNSISLNLSNHFTDQIRNPFDKITVRRSVFKNPTQVEKCSSCYMPNGDCDCEAQESSDPESVESVAVSPKSLAKTPQRQPASPRKPQTSPIQPLIKKEVKFELAQPVQVKQKPPEVVANFNRRKDNFNKQIEQKLKVHIRPYGWMNTQTSSDSEEEVKLSVNNKAKGRKCKSFKLICKLQSVGMIGDHINLQRDLENGKFQNVMSAPNSQIQNINNHYTYVSIGDDFTEQDDQMCTFTPQFWMFEILCVEKKNINDMSDEIKDLKDRMVMSFFLKT